VFAVSDIKYINIREKKMLEGMGTYVQLTIKQRITDTSTVGNMTWDLI